MPDHVNMHEDEAGLGAGRVEALFEGADQAEVGVGGAEVRGGEAIVEEGVGAGVFEEGLEAGAVGEKGVCESNKFF